MKKLFWLILLTLILSACGNAPTVEPTREPQALTLTATDIKFDQTSFEVTAGQPVKLTYANQGALEHDFSIQAIAVTNVHESGDHLHHDMGSTPMPDLHVAIGAGQTVVLTFTPTTPGTYEFFCAIAGHKDAGMTGQLIVK